METIMISLSPQGGAGVRGSRAGEAVTRTMGSASDPQSAGSKINQL
jgi:hypothetical protein